MPLSYGLVRAKNQPYQSEAIVESLSLAITVALILIANLSSILADPL